ncbi:MAG: hypothetical protein F6J89_24995 [Symploca sp. SIO1C4]|uniref:Uncharacterized protein n=1 Tax=Symploca sp. SIO1C4 TaxID=2607765 RepID=A0A6B3NIR4_9CYAN|nr:hypothetical protein [Symploca sp. SIO1C4]
MHRNSLKPIKQEYAVWLESLNSSAVEALATDEWAEVVGLIYDKMKTKPQPEEMTPRLIELFKELIEACEPFTEWGSYGESMILTEVVHQAKQFVYGEESH